MRCYVAYTLDQQCRGVGKADIQRKALAYQSRDLVLMFENVRAGDNAARTVTKHEDRNARIFRPCDLNQFVHVAQIVRKLLDVKSLAFRLASTAEVKGVSGKTCAGE